MVCPTFLLVKNTNKKTLYYNLIVNVYCENQVFELSFKGLLDQHVVLEARSLRVENMRKKQLNGESFKIREA